MRRHGFEVFHLDPSRFQPFPDGSRLLVWDDVASTQAEIARFSRRDAANYPKWLAFWERAAGLIYPYFLKPPPTLGELARQIQGTDDEALLDRLLTASMNDILADFFETEAMRAGFV